MRHIYVCQKLRVASFNYTRNHISARSSGIAEGPRDVLSKLKSFQLLHECTKNRILEGLR